MKFCIYNVTTAIKVGGIETYCWEIAKALRDLGHEVEIISGKGKEVKYPFLKLTTFSFKERNAFPDFGTRFRKLMERLSFFKNAKTYLKTNNWDVFLITKPFDFVVTHYVKRRHPNCKTVFVSGGEDFWWFDKWFAKSIDVFVSVSKANAEIIKKRFKRKVVVVPNGVDVEKFKPNEELRKKIKNEFRLEDKKVLISVGRIVGWKGYQIVIKTLPFLSEEYVYVLIGDGKYLPELKKLAKELKVENRVIFLGKKPHNELPKYYLLGDVFIQPSIGEEAFGITVIEAMACGLPVIGSKSGGIKELIREGENGFLFEPKKEGFEKELLDKIKIAYKNKNTLGQKARSFVEKNFAWKEIAKSLLATLK